MEAGIGSCVGAAGVVAAWGAGNDAAIVAAIEVAIVVEVPVSSSSSLTRSLGVAERVSDANKELIEPQHFGYVTFPCNFKSYPTWISALRGFAVSDIWVGVWVQYIVTYKGGGEVLTRDLSGETLDR